MNYKLCAILPTYNHYLQLPKIVQKLLDAGLPVFIVDDGSVFATQQAIETIGEAQKIRLPINSGKGAALEEGLKCVLEQGYTHAFQIDADGQHSLADLDAFINLSRINPQAILSGKPVYDSSVPLERKIGRWFTHIWVWIETWSFKISDSMCGYRIYPIQQTLDIIRNSSIGKRMDFDTEILVRMFWKGIPVLMHPVKVTYPKGNHSNFDVLNDNWRITKMHTRLVFTMLAKLPSIIKNRPDYSRIRGTI